MHFCWKLYPFIKLYLSLKYTSKHRNRSTRLVKPIDIATRTKTKCRLHWGLEWRWEHIGAWLHGYLNGGSTKTKTNGE